MYNNYTENISVEMKLRKVANPSLKIVLISYNTLRGYHLLQYGASLLPSIYFYFG